MADNDLVSLDLSSLDPALRDELRKQLELFSGNVSPQSALAFSAEMADSLKQVSEEKVGAVTIDLSRLEDPTIRENLRENLNKFASELNPRLAVIVSGEIGALNLESNAE